MNLETELWANIPVADFAHLYKISNRGRLLILSRKVMFGPHLVTRPDKIAIGCPDKNGYLIFCLREKDKCKMVKIHRLVAQAFIPNPENKKEVNHKDGDKQNNNDWNLEWATPLENITHAVRKGLIANCRPIIQENLNGKIVKEWNSVKDILDNGVISKTHFHRIMREGKIYNDCKWYYKQVA